MESSETLRKLLHIGAGVTPPLFIAAFGWTGTVALALFLLAYLWIGVDSLSRGVRLPLVAGLIQGTSRTREGVPWGALDFLTVAVALGLLFPLPYALGALALLGVGDGVATLAGRRWGRPALPWNPHKTWVGLAFGLLGGVPAFVGFAILGGTLQAAGYAEVSNLWGPLPTLYVLGFLVGGFLTVHAFARLWVRQGVLPRVANATPGVVVGAFFVALAPTLAFLMVAPQWFEGPLLAPLGGHGPLAQAALVAVPIVALVLESALRHHDNLWVPSVAATGAYLVVAALGAA